MRTIVLPHIQSVLLYQTALYALFELGEGFVAQSLKLSDFAVLGHIAVSVVGLSTTPIKENIYPWVPTMGRKEKCRTIVEGNYHWYKKWEHLLFPFIRSVLLHQTALYVSFDLSFFGEALVAQSLKPVLRDVAMSVAGSSTKPLKFYALEFSLPTRMAVTMMINCALNFQEGMGKITSHSMYSTLEKSSLYQIYSFCKITSDTKTGSWKQSICLQAVIGWSKGSCPFVL